MKEDTKYLTSIRGLACLMVVVAHILASISTIGKNVSGCGKIGVWLFFVLSSFLLTNQFINKSKIKGKDVIEFYIKRFFRIYPCYITILLISLLINYITEIKTIIKHIFLLEGIGHFWTIPVEFIFYIIFPVLMYILLKFKSQKKSVVFLIMLLVIFEFCFPYWKCPENSPNLKWYLPVFIMGMITSYVFQYFKDKSISSIVCDIMIVIIIICIICSIPYFRKLIFNIEPDNYLQNKYIYFGLAWSIIILAIQNSKYIIHYLNNTKLLLWFGNVSFPLYLIHFIVLNKLKIQNTIMNSFAVFIISVILAGVMNKFIEQPMIQCAKKINYKFLRKGDENGKV